MIKIINSTVYHLPKGSTPEYGMRICKVCDIVNVDKYHHPDHERYKLQTKYGEILYLKFNEFSKSKKEELLRNGYIKEAILI